MERFGTLDGISQYSIESFIGWNGDRNRARHLPAESMTNTARFGESCTIVFQQFVQKGDSA